MFVAKGSFNTSILYQFDTHKFKILYSILSLKYIILIIRAAEALVELLSIEEIEKRATFPDNYPIREVSCHLACRVIEQAIAEDIKIGNKVAYERFMVSFLLRTKILLYLTKKLVIPGFYLFSL